MAADATPHSQTVDCGCSSPGTEVATDVLRCTCGSLLARYVGGQVELKCRRCKRTVYLAIEGIEAHQAHKPR
jgi:phage FluMu protein Com